MNAEEKLYGMMAVIEEQQKVLSTSMAEFKKVTEELRTQKSELSNTVDSISSAVSHSVAKDVILELGAAQKSFNNEMMASCSQSLKIAKDVAKDLTAAKETSKYIYDSSENSDQRGWKDRYYFDGCILDYKWRVNCIFNMVLLVKSG
jgi:hypothetical protein